MQETNDIQNWASKIDSASTVSELNSIIDNINEKYRNINKPSELLYYLGNAYSLLAERVKKDNSFSWYQHTVKYRTLSKFHYTEAIKKGIRKPILLTRAYANRANHLYTGLRWIEALHEYKKALKINHKNGVASSGIIKIAMEKMKIGIMHPDITRILVTTYLPLFRASTDMTKQLIGTNNLEYLPHRCIKYASLVNLLTECCEDFIVFRFHTVVPTYRKCQFSLWSG